MEVKEMHINQLGLQEPIVSQCIMDVEISNNLEKFNWDYNKGEVCVVGILLGNKITQFLLYNIERIKKFKNEVNDFLSKLTQTPYAFNTNMEIGCIKNLLGKEIQFSEIKPFSGRGASKEYFFGFLIKNEIINTIEKLIDPLNGNANLVESLWKEKRYEDVRNHNICCLVKEAFILKHKKEIIKKHKNLINEDGWLKDGITL